jgi:hypothetical protein
MEKSSFVRALVAGVLTIAVVMQVQAQGKGDDAHKKLIARGKYLVNLGGCNHCHTPKVMGPKGPMDDESHRLAGSPAGEPVPALPGNDLGPGKWGAVVSMDMTMWGGPWGVSFTRNLTSDKETGLGSWTDAVFIKAMRTGKDMGEGRPILPPMPWEDIGKLPDADLKAIFAYLQSVPPVKNAVHDPIPPAGGPGGGH